MMMCVAVFVRRPAVFRDGDRVGGSDGHVPLHILVDRKYSLLFQPTLKLHPGNRYMGAALYAVRTTLTKATRIHHKYAYHLT